MNSILDQTAHRPFPVPASPWVMKQSWCDLLFAHWPVPAAQLRNCIPAGLELDTYGDDAWVGVVPFAMKAVYPRLLMPLPWISYFLELNVRTYVRRQGIPGVYFFSLDCSNPVAVKIARQFFHLPYFDARMSLARRGNEIHYESKRLKSGQEFRAVYSPVEANPVALDGSIEHFLTERYCLFTSDKSGRLYQGNIHHLPWPLQKAEAEIITNTMISEDLGFRLPDCEPLLHFSERLDTFEWALQAVAL